MGYRDKAIKRDEARARLITRIADEFEASGIRYTCRAVVMDFARSRVVPITEDWPREWLVHQSFFMRKIERDVADEIHKRWNAWR